MATAECSAEATAEYSAVAEHLTTKWSLWGCCWDIFFRHCLLFGFPGRSRMRFREGIQNYTGVLIDFGVYPESLRRVLVSTAALFSFLQPHPKKASKLEQKWSRFGFQSQTILALGTHLRGFVRPGVQVEPQVLPEASWQTWLGGVPPGPPWGVPGGPSRGKTQTKDRGPLDRRIDKDGKTQKEDTVSHAVTLLRRVGGYTTQSEDQVWTESSFNLSSTLCREGFGIPPFSSTIPFKRRRQEEKQRFPLNHSSWGLFGGRAAAVHCNFGQRSPACVTGWW